MQFCTSLITGMKMLRGPRELAAHFQRNGIAGHFSAVRHGFSHSKVRAVAAFRMQEYPVPVVLTDCNGNLVSLPAWGDDTVVESTAFRKAFRSFSFAGQT